MGRTYKNLIISDPLLDIISENKRYTVSLGHRLAVYVS